MKIKIVVFLAMLGFCNTSCNKAQQQPKSIPEITENFKSELHTDLQNDKVAGLSMILLNRDSTIWTDNFGWADKDKKLAATSETKYLIGSVTKVFTAIAVMQLHEKGIINIDSSFQKYLPEFNMKTRFGKISDITVRQLLTHHAGLPEDIWLHKFSKKPPPYTEIIGFANQQYTAFKPGHIMSYSNLGFTLLGIMVEKVSGLKYTDYVEQYIFKPLQMNNSGFYTSFEQRKNFAPAYNIDQVAMDEYPLIDIPAGAIYSSANDMAKFAKALINSGSVLLEKETLEEMYRAQNMNVALDLDDRIGLCFNISNKALEAGRIYEHGGATIYHRAQLYLAPDCGLAAVVLSNSEIGTKNVWKVKEKLIADIARYNGFKADNSKNPWKDVNFANRSDTDMGKFAGYYATPGITHQLLWKNNMLFTRIMGNEFYLKLNGEHTFNPAKRFLGMTFAKKDMVFLFEEIENQKLFIEAKPWGDLNIVSQMVDKPVITKLWKDKFGDYVPVNTSSDDFEVVKDLKLTELDGFPTLGFKIAGLQKVDLALKILSNEEAVVLGLGRAGGETVFLGSEKDKNYLIFKGIKFEQKLQ